MIHLSICIQDLTTKAATERNVLLRQSEEATAYSDCQYHPVHEGTALRKTRDAAMTHFMRFQVYIKPFCSCIGSYSFHRQNVEALLFLLVHSTHAKLIVPNGCRRRPFLLTAALHPPAPPEKVRTSSIVNFTRDGEIATNLHSQLPGK